MKTKKVKFNDIDLGDIILFDDGDIGRVVRKARTLWHDHRYIEIMYITFNRYDGESTKRVRIYEHNKIKFKKIIL